MLVIWVGCLALMRAEVLADQPRCAEIKIVYMLNTAQQLFRFRIALLHMTFGGALDSGMTSSSRANSDVFCFVLSLGVAVTGLLAPTRRSVRTSYGEMTEDAPAHREKSQDAHPVGEHDASWLAQMVFSWMTPMLKKGKEEQLTDSALTQLLQEDTSNETGNKLLVAWLKQLDSNPDDPSLLMALKDVWGSQMILSGFFKLINDSVVFVGPVLLQALVQFVENPNVSDRSMVDGALLAMGIFVAKTIESIAVNQYFHVGYRTGGQIRSAVTMLVYRKSFLLSSKGLQRYKLGEMVQLMSVDAVRLCNSAPYLHLIWSAPFQLVVSTALLYNVVGASVFGGLTLMVVLIPVNTYIAQKQQALNKEIMKIKDERSNVMDEILQGIRVIKYFAWERSFIAKVNAIRESEIALIWRNALWGICSVFLWAGSPMLVALITFAFYVWGGSELKPSTAFAALALFNVMRFPLNTLPMIISLIIESQVALERLQGYLAADEINRKYYKNADPKEAGNPHGVEFSRVNSDSGDARGTLMVRSAQFSWAKGTPGKKEDKKKPMSFAAKLQRVAEILVFKRTTDKEKDMTTFDTVLRDIDFEIPAGKLCIIVGKVGCGKSSLLSAILGELKKDRGEVSLTGKVVYAAQQPWIKNATLKDNILFGAELDEERYQEVLEACSLLPDLDVLPAGDQTEIGEKGINLSGGQKARISLARAVYGGADVYLLDDPLSAVDVHVSKHLFDKCIKGYLKGKTVILVTHQIQYLPDADIVINLEDSHITHMGDYEAVVSENPHLVDNAHGRHGEDGGGSSLKPSGSYDNLMEAAKSQGNGVSREVAKEAKEGGDKKKAGTAKAGAAKANASTLSNQGGNLTKKEGRKAGQVDKKVWIDYCKSMGMHIAAIILGVYVFSQFCQLLSDWWLAGWSSQYVRRDELVREAEQEAALAGTTPETIAAVDVGYYLFIYFLLVVLACFSVTFRSGMVAVGVIRAARKGHDGMLNCVVRAPTRFFDTTPMGRVLNRFTTDQYTLDNDLRQTVSMVLMCVIRVAQVSFFIIYVTPGFIPVVILLGFVYFKVQEFYRSSSRELKRLESVAKSPIFSHFSETLNGLSTIRAFSTQQQFFEASRGLNDTYSRAYFNNNASNRWLAIRLEFIGNMAVGCAALFAVLQSDSPTDAGLIGLSITYALEVTGTLNWSIRTFTQLETYMIASERIKEFSTMETEAPAVIDSNRPPKTWPAQGKLVFSDVKLRYREELEPALKGVSFATEAGEKIGIVGRTGAGKTTLAVALFRITEIFSGSIRLDGIDVSKIGLDDLRTRIAIIPQVRSPFVAPSALLCCSVYRLAHIGMASCAPVMCPPPRLGGQEEGGAGGLEFRV
jgi:ATP-binding cassette subfamily C (CFTR/MRP) protein 1